MDKPNGHHIPDATPAIIDVGAIPEHALALQREPQVVIAEATRAAQALAALIADKPNRVVINNEIYLEYEDWQLLGRFYQISAAVIAGSTKYLEYGDVVGFEASAEALLLVDGRPVRISGAEAMCLNDEWRWTDKPLFQLRSMAQTRACAKALRNVLAWVVVMAGFKPTPSEELDGERGSEPVIATPRRQSQQQQPPAAPPRQDPPRRQDPPQRPRAGERYQQRFDPYHRRPARANHGRGRGPDGRLISDGQINRLFAIARDNRVSKAELRRIVNHFGFAVEEEITRDVYEDICDRVFKVGE